MNIHKDVKQLITSLLKLFKRYLVISITIVATLRILLFLSSVEAGKSIGDAVWG